METHGIITNRDATDDNKGKRRFCRVLLENIQHSAPDLLENAAKKKLVISSIPKATVAVRNEAKVLTGQKCSVVCDKKTCDTMNDLQPTSSSESFVSLGGANRRTKHSRTNMLDIALTRGSFFYDGGLMRSCYVRIRDYRVKQRKPNPLENMEFFVGPMDNKKEVRRNRKRSSAVGYSKPSGESKEN